MMVSRRDRNFGGLFPRGYRGFDGFGFWFLTGGNNTKLHGFVREESFLVRWCRRGKVGRGGEAALAFYVILRA